MKNKLKKFYIVKEKIQDLAFLGKNIIRNASIVLYKNEEEMLQDQVFSQKDFIVTFYKEIKWRELILYLLKNYPTNG